MLVVLWHLRALPGMSSGNIHGMIFIPTLMPLFFFIAGLFLPVGKSFGQIVAERINRQIIPWLVFTILAGIICEVILKLSPSALTSYLHWSKWLFRWPNTPLYFLRALTLGIIFAWCLAVICRTRPQRIAVLILLSALSYATFATADLRSMHNIFCMRFISNISLAEATAMTMYIWLGHMVATEAGTADLRISRPRAAIIFILASAALLALGHPVMQWHTVSPGSPWLHVTASVLCGIVAIWALACLLQGFRPLVFIGRYSLVILVTHYAMMYMFMQAFGWQRVQTAWLVLVLLPIVCAAFVKYMPWAVGKKDLFEWRDGRLRLIRRKNHTK